MKRIARILVVALMGVSVATVDIGCASTPATGGEISLDQTYQQVEEAMLKFRDESIGGNLTNAEREGVQTAYKGFQTAYKSALAVAGSNKKSAAPDSVKAAAEDVVARVSAIP